ncbi:pyruvate kinase [Jonquetella anthropi]|uniref:pyruvate kinase n=1 Tax=Jonquetella anthropi TaxID=428712 RepID=UPI0001B9117E|nr:pyruvate kinase [Jonquetella anthropi]EEX48203.1 pyruvate kinase [Jonquetella anthropi E3_33 E1]
MRRKVTLEMTRKVKIVCTLGPASLADGVLESIVDAGLDVARLNFSHGTHEGHGQALQAVRRLEEKKKQPIAVMLDTKGPEIRTTLLKNDEPVQLVPGQTFVLRPDDGQPGDATGVGVTESNLAEECQVGQDVFIDDGTIHLIVREKRDADLICTVDVGGMLGNRKGINLPGAELSLPSMSDRDKDDIIWGVRNGVDCIAVSFVRDRNDVLAVRRVVEEQGANTRLIAKIETKKAVENLESIADVVDGMMIARGDLGVEIPTEDVPLVQKRIIDLCRLRGKTTIVATQMLDSMIRNPRPTRAEANDVSNAVLDGADAVMLSGETAAGKYPLLAVQTMAKIVVRSEEELRRWQRPLKVPVEAGVPDGVAMAAVEISRKLGASAVISLTKSGSTARLVSKYRPSCPIVATTPSVGTTRELCLCWGVVPVLCPTASDGEQAVARAVEASLAAGLVNQGDLVVVTAGVPLDVPGTTNLIQVQTVGRIVASGLPVLPGVVTGRACVCRTPEDLHRFQPGDILVAEETDKSFIPAMEKAAAVVTAEGGLTSHGAIVSLELRIPAVVGAAGVADKLKNDSIITVDSGKGLIYEGRVNLGAGSK